MAQVGATVGAHGFNANHAEADVPVLFNRARDGQGKTGPAAASVKLGAGFEQFRAAADAVVAAVSPVLFVLAGIGPLCGGVTGDLVGHGFGVFGVE